MLKAGIERREDGDRGKSGLGIKDQDRMGKEV